MNRYVKTIVVAGLLLAISCIPTLAAKKAALEATIVNTGSTNTTGYSITVAPSGHVDYTVLTRLTRIDKPRIVSGQIKKTLAQQLFRDITAAMPLDQLPVRHMMKSVSFGTSTYVEYNGQKTPDLSAPADARGQALLTDMQNIAAALNLKNGPRRPVGSVVPPLPGQ